MKAQHLILVPCLIVLTACHTESAAIAPNKPGSLHVASATSLSDIAVTLGASAVDRRRTSAREDSLIEAVVAHFTGRREEFLREALYDQRAGIPRIASAPPDVQRLLDQIAALRKARADSAAAFQTAHVPYPATVALVSRLPVKDSAATAVILRRANAVPHDIILLPSGATLAAYGSAVHMLVLARKAGGDTPERDEVLLVHGAKVPRGWDSTGFATIAAHDLARLRGLPSAQVAGVGAVPSMTIEISPTHVHR